MQLVRLEVVHSQENENRLIFFPPSASHFSFVHVTKHEKSRDTCPIVNHGVASVIEAKEAPSLFLCLAAAFAAACQLALRLPLWLPVRFSFFFFPLFWEPKALLIGVSVISFSLS